MHTFLNFANFQTPSIQIPWFPEPMIPVMTFEAVNSKGTHKDTKPNAKFLKSNGGPEDPGEALASYVEAGG